MDPLTYVGVSAALGIVALLAIYLPRTGRHAWIQSSPYEPKASSAEVPRYG